MSSKRDSVSILRVHVDLRPEPTLIRAAIVASLEGRPWAGPERAIGEAVAEAAGRARDRSKPWH
jgi:hypothetical protein